MILGNEFAEGGKSFHMRADHAEGDEQRHRQYHADGMPRRDMARISGCSVVAIKKANTAGNRKSRAK